MLITIITVAWNAAATIADTCRSVAAQRHGEIEHIIIDGASTDDTVTIARRHLRAGGRIVSERDRGLYDAMNKGIALAQGEVVGFLNADDLYAHDRAVAAIAAAMADPATDACCGDLVYVDQSDTSAVRRRWRTGAVRPAAIPMGWIPAHPTFYTRRAVYARCGGYDLAYRLAADHECLARLLHRHRVRTVRIPQVLVRMRLGGATNVSWRNIIAQNCEILSGMRANHIPISPLLPLWKILDRLRQRSASARLMQALVQRRAARGVA